MKDKKLKLIMTKSEIDNLQLERQLIQKGYKYICGVDEVGRGPLAGPVVCAAVIMPLGENDIIEGVTDSKKISEKKRKVLSAQIMERALSYSICEISPEEIDEINILEATKKCMKNAVESLKISPEMVFVDALTLDVSFPQQSIIKGDAKSYSIGSASIIAKVYRDNLMEEYAKIYPEYGFEKHKGYGTKAHIDAIKENGPCLIHRRTFIKNFWVETGKN